MWRLKPRIRYGGCAIIQHRSVGAGNNETEAAFSWGPRPTLPPDVRLLIWQDYLTVFSGILPRVVARLDPETPYWAELAQRRL